MTTSSSAPMSPREGTERPLWQRAWRPLAAATIMVAGLSACGDDGRDDAGGADPEAHRSTASGGRGDRDAILIKTRMLGFKGQVLAGSALGDVPFCAGGSVRHEPGSPDIGFPAVNVFHCTDGQLRIGFGPGPDQMDNAVQTSDWKVLGGTGRYAHMRGDGEMRVRFESAGASEGRETFTGEVTTR